MVMKEAPFMKSVRCNRIYLPQIVLLLNCSQEVLQTIVIHSLALFEYNLRVLGVFYFESLHSDCIKPQFGLDLA